MRMTNEELIAVIQAYEDGVIIESRRNDHEPGQPFEWLPLDFASAWPWDTDTFTYRIKSKPREWWIHIKRNPRSTRELYSAELYPCPQSSVVADDCVEIHVREVTP